MASTMDAMSPSIPGSYLFQHDHNRNKSRSHNIFNPPAPSPTPSRRASHIPRTASRSSNPNSGRKRPKLDANTSYFSRPSRPSIYGRSSTSTSLNLGGSFDNLSYSNLESSTYSLDGQNVASPSPLANSTYKLAGGLDTPSASFERGLEELAQDEAEKDYRVNRYTTTNTSTTTLSLDSSRRFGSQSQTPGSGVLSDTSRKRSRSVPSSLKQSGSTTGWGIRRTAWALTGGIAGRVFNFCLNTAFRGFNAGGGQSYFMDTSGLGDKSINANSNAQSGHMEKEAELSNSYIQDHDLGGFIEDYINSPEARRTHYDHDTMAASSQWQTSNPDRSAIKNDWQMIDQTTLDDSDYDRSPARKRTCASVAGGWQRSGSRPSSATGASYASPRKRSSQPVAVTATGPYSQHQRTNSNGSNPFQPIRRSRSSFAPARHSVSYLPTSQTTTNTGYGQLSPERPSSSASNRQTNRVSTSHNNPTSNSNLSPEVATYKRKVRAQERLQDENIRRLNAQLRDMIREGREALGSTVEIVDGHDRGGGHVTGSGIRVESKTNNEFDEGYYEDGWQ